MGLQRPPTLKLYNLLNNSKVVRFTSDFLGLPQNIVPLCIIPVGVPAENPEPKDKWKPENIHWEQW